MQNRYLEQYIKTEDLAGMSVSSCSIDKGGSSHNFPFSAAEKKTLYCNIVSVNVGT